MFIICHQTCTSILTAPVNCVIVVTESDDVATAVGERLDLVNVSRYCADIYECSASNNIPPAVKRHIKLTVECTYCICLYFHFMAIDDRPKMDVDIIRRIRLSRMPYYCCPSLNKL